MQGGLLTSRKVSRNDHASRAGHNDRGRNGGKKGEQAVDGHASCDCQDAGLVDLLRRARGQDVLTASAPHTQLAVQITPLDTIRLDGLALYSRCWARCLFISNMLTLSLPNTARSLSSALISRLFCGFWSLCVLM